MLVGREDEQGTLDQILCRARESLSGSVLLTGEPGIGKTALLEYARDRAIGMQVLETRGSESEGALPFAALATLLRPIVHRLDEIPAVQAAALSGALALGPPVAGDRFSVGAATLSLLAAAADAGPVLVLVDDAHWVDAASSEALRFATRRLDAEGVAVLLARRTGEGAEYEGVCGAELQLSGLGRLAAEAVLANQPAAVSAELAGQLHAATAGNPLALLEIPATLSAEQRSGQAPLDEPVTVGTVIGEAFGRRVALLPEATRRAMTVASASESGAIDELARALVSIGLAVADLEAAETASLIGVADGHVTFRHPLVRSAVYHGASAPERRAAHAALAVALTDSQDDRRAWHLAGAAVGPDEDAAGALEAAGSHARSRGGYAGAAAAMERAATLSVAADRQSARLVAGAESAFLAGDCKHALALLDQALIVTSQEVLRSEAVVLRGRVLGAVGATAEAARLLLEEAAAVEASQPARAALMLMEAAIPQGMDGHVGRALATARRAHDLCARVDAAEREQIEPIAATILGMYLIMSGEAVEGVPLTVASIPGVPDGPFFSGLQMLPLFLIAVEEHEGARSLLERLMLACRSKGMVGDLPLWLGVMSELDLRTGRWVSAYAQAAECIRLSEQTGQQAQVLYGLAVLGRVEAVLGQSEDCRAHAGQVMGAARMFGIESLLTLGQAALGLLEVGLGRFDEAIVQLEPVAEMVERNGMGEPGLIQWAPDLIESYVRAGRLDEARGALDRFEQQGRSTGRSWALATAARLRGLLADPDHHEAEFVDALRWHDCTDTPFERARTQVCFGEGLRRARRRADARIQLRSALETFERLGATSWARRASTELEATGEKARKRTPSATHALTPQELRVAQVVAEGVSTREAATVLFLSPEDGRSPSGTHLRKAGHTVPSSAGPSLRRSGRAEARGGAGEKTLT